MITVILAAVRARRVLADTCSRRAAASMVSASRRRPADSQSANEPAGAGASCTVSGADLYQVWHRHPVPSAN